MTSQSVVTDRKTPLAGVVMRMAPGTLGSLKKSLYGPYGLANPAPK